MRRVLAKVVLVAVAVLQLSAPVLASWQDDLNANLAEQARLQQLIASSKTQENTLSNQIGLYNNQIQLTQLQLNAKQTELDQKQAELDRVTGSIGTVTTQIGDTQTQLVSISKVAVARFRVQQAVQNASPVDLSFITGQGVTDITNLSYQTYIEHKDNEVFGQLLQLKKDLSGQKADLVGQQVQIASLRDTIKSDRDAVASSQQKLLNQKSSLAYLLSVTKNNESSYQRQLSQAQAQLQTLLATANARVGSGGSLVAHSEISDGWGKYYNQRDTAWGNVYIGYSNYQIWQVGCLLTSVAMVFAHYGNTSTTPTSIGANPANFWGSTAAMNIPGPAPAGHSASHYSDPSISFLKNQVAAGNPVILGLSFNGGSIAAGYYPDHWVVARGLDSRGEFMINDPWYYNSMNVALDYSHSYNTYRDSMIIEARVYQ